MTDRREILACDLTVLDDAQRARRAELVGLVRTDTIRVVERPDGYALHLREGAGTLQRVEELMQLERRCCPFLELKLTRAPATGGAVLEITGSAEAKAIIAAEVLR